MKKFDLSANPIARTFVENFIVLFNGDLAELRRRYEASFTVEEAFWQLRLVPRHAPLNRSIASITMRGDSQGMRSMKMLESAGDVTETSFSRVDANPQIRRRRDSEYFDPPNPTNSRAVR